MTSVALLALTDCYATSLGGMSAVLLLANKLNRTHGEHYAKFTWRVLSLDGKNVCTGTHIKIASDGAIDKAVYDIICVPALHYADRDTFLQRLQQFQPLYTWLQHQWQSGATIVASGTGTFVLAESGLLNGHRATTVHWLTNRFRRRYPEVRVQEHALITEDDRLLCSAASTAYLRMAQRLVDLFMGQQIAAECARAILLDAGLSGEETQLPNYINSASHSPLIARINDWAEHHLSNGFNIDELAEDMAMSVRTLHRHVLKDTGMTPANYLQQRRIETARRLLESTDFSILEIAQRIGYSDSSAFSRVFTRSLGVAPAQYRNKFRLDFV